MILIKFIIVLFVLTLICVVIMGAVLALIERIR